MLSISNDQNDQQLETCDLCAFNLFDDGRCAFAPCMTKERKDKSKGYFEKV